MTIKETRNRSNAAGKTEVKSYFNRLHQIFSFPAFSIRRRQKQETEWAKCVVAIDEKNRKTKGRKLAEVMY